MYSNAYENNDFTRARNLIANKEFRKAYNLLQSKSDKSSEWYYLTGLAAMNMGYYEEGEDYLKRAKFMEPNIKNILMLIIDITIIEMIMTDVLMTITEIDVMIQMVAVAVVAMIVAVIYAPYTFAILVANVLEEICVLVSKRG